MPITIKSTELKYKNPSTGQYQGIDAVAETTTSQQCALIEAKGAETIASIPSDYTTLSDTVDDLNGAITDLSTESTATLEAIAYLEDTNVATKRTYQKGECVFIKQYNRLYKTSDTVPQGTSFVGKIIYLPSGGFNSVIEEGTWTPQLYDNNTFLRNFPTQKYWKLGKLYILTINIMPSDAFDFTGISTNMVIKGSPCPNLQTGIILNQYIPWDSNKGKNIQGYNDTIYLRDNLTSADMTTQYNLSFKLIVFGFDN